MDANQSTAATAQLPQILSYGKISGWLFYAVHVFIGKSMAPAQNLPHATNK